MKIWRFVTATPLLQEYVMTTPAPEVGFFCAESGSKTPPKVLSSASATLASTRSPFGTTCMVPQRLFVSLSSRPQLQSHSQSGFEEKVCCAAMRRQRTLEYCVGTSTTAALTVRFRVVRGPAPGLSTPNDAQGLHLGSRLAAMQAGRTRNSTAGSRRKEIAC